MKKISQILLVDDDEIANHINKLLIEDLNLAYDIEMAHNGEEALEIIKDKKWQPSQQQWKSLLVFLDLNMPVMDGFDFLTALEKNQELNNNLLIVILTSSDNQKDLEKARQYNIHGYIDKPLTEKKLKEMLNSIE